MIFFDLNLVLKIAFLTLKVLVFPPLIISISLFIKYFGSFKSFTTRVTLEKLSFSITSKLCSKILLFLKIFKSLLFFDENLVLLPAAKSIK